MTDLERAGWRMVPIERCATCGIQAAADHVCHLRELLELTANTTRPDLAAGLELIKSRTAAADGPAAAGKTPREDRDMTESTDRTVQMIVNEMADARQTMDAEAQNIAGWRERVADAEQRHAEAEAHLRTLTSLRAIMSGQGQALQPGDVKSGEGVIGMVIGALALTPPEDATVEELTAYVDTMRALNHQASHQAVIATGRVRELEAATDQPAEPISASHDSRHDAGIWQLATCKWCSARIIRNTLTHGEWAHPNNGSVRCHPVDGEQSPLAEPVDPAPNGPDVHPAAPVPCDDCETTGSNCLAHGGRPDRRNYRSILDPAACPGCGRLHFPWCAPHGGPQAGPSQADWLVATGQQETREQPAVAPAGPDPLAPLPPNVIDGRTEQTRPDMPPPAWGPWGPLTAPVPPAGPFDIGPDPEPAEDDDPGTGKTSAEATR